MKQVLKPLSLKMLALSFLLALVQVIAFAQESGGSSGGGSSSTTTTTKSIDITTSGSENWYASPWVWVIGAALFILLLIALLGGNRGGSRTTTTSTTAANPGAGTTVQRTTQTDTDL